MGTVGRGRCCSCCLGSEIDAQRNLLNVCGGGVAGVGGGGLLTAVALWIQGCQSQSLSFGSPPGLAGPLWLCLGQLDFIRGDPDTQPAPLSQGSPASVRPDPGSPALEALSRLP